MMRKLEEKIFFALTAGATLFIVLILVLIIGKIAIEAMPAMQPSYLFQSEFDAGGFGLGIGNALIGTILIAVIAVALATPVGLGTAIYLKKYAKDNIFTHFIRSMIEVLSGTPSILIGVVGLFILCIVLKPLTGGISLLSGSIALSVLIIPVIIRSIEEAIDTVPKEIEEGSYALGATKWDTIWKIIIPISMSGIITGIVLSVGRAAEESSVVIMTAGYSQFFPAIELLHKEGNLFNTILGPFQEPVATLPMAVYHSYDLPQYVDQSHGYAAAFTLIILVFLINATARLILRGPGIAKNLRLRFNRRRMGPVPLAAGAGPVASTYFAPIELSVPSKQVSTESIGFATTSKKGDQFPQVPEKRSNTLLLPAGTGSETDPSIYSPETTDKTGQTLIKSDTLMSDPSSYPPESKHPPAALTPVEDVRDGEENAEPAPQTYEAPEPPSRQEIEETLKPDEDGDKIKKFVKWFTTDPKREAAKKIDAPSQAAANMPASAVSRATQKSASTQATSAIEIIPASFPRKKAHTNPNLEIIPPANGPLIAGTDTEPDPNLIIYPPQSPPSMREVSETLGPKGKRDDKVGDLVKWFTTDPKKEAKKVKAVEAPGAAAAAGKVNGNGKAANASLSKLYGMNGGAAASSGGNGSNSGGEAQVKARRSSITLPNLFGTGSLKQKNGNDMPEFNVGKLSQPMLDGSIKATDFTYAIEPPFQYVRIFFDGEELVYNVLEPAISENQKKYTAIIERGLEKLISSKIVAIKPEEREQFLRQKFDEIIGLYGWNLSEVYRDRMFYYLRKRYLGFDKIDAIMKDHYIEDISCNGPNTYMYIFHRIYGSVRTNVSYGDVDLNKFVMRLAQLSGRHISILQPIKDISLPDGSRANLTLGTEVTKKGATFTIRKFKERPISPIELLDYNSISSHALAYLWTLLDYKRSILVSGGTASGKTTLMNALCIFIRPEMKIVSLEDTPELNLVHPNWIQSVTRSGFGTEASGASGISSGVSGISGISSRTPGNIGLYDLLVAALRQRPEYIIVGEVRGAEAFTLFQAIAVGHACMGTIHAGNMRELISRVESNPMNVPRTLFSAMDVVCFSALIRKGDRNVRRVMQIVEILELDTEGNLITNPVFRWDAVADRFVFTGKSHIFEKIEALLGIREEALIEEMNNRAAFLQDLRQGGIRDYAAVVEQIRDFELNKLTGGEKS